MTLEACYKAIASYDQMQTLTLGERAVYGRSKEGYHIMAIVCKEGFVELWIDAAPVGIYSNVDSLIQRIKDDHLSRCWVDPLS